MTPSKDLYKGTAAKLYQFRDNEPVEKEPVNEPVVLFKDVLGFL